jgi:hypothetical protein
VLEGQDIAHARQVEKTAYDLWAVDQRDPRVGPAGRGDQEMQAARVEERRRPKIDHDRFEAALREIVNRGSELIHGVQVELAMRLHEHAPAIGPHLDAKRLRQRGAIAALADCKPMGISHDPSSGPQHQTGESDATARAISSACSTEQAPAATRHIAPPPLRS